MKYLLIFLALCASMLAADSLAQSQGQFYDISDDEVASAAQSPNEVYEIIGRTRQSKPTWALIETNGQPSGSSGVLRAIHRGKVATTYTVGGVDTVALPNNRFRMNKDSILCTSKGQKIEAIILEMKTCLCTKKTGLVFARDSTTLNTHPSTYKKVMKLDEFGWLQAEGLLRPTISSHLVDSVDGSKESAYAVSVTTDSGANCALLWLHREERPGIVKEIVYTVSPHEGKRFAVTQEGGYTFDEEPIQSLLVLKSYQPKGIGKAKKGRHNTRTRTR